MMKIKLIYLLLVSIPLAISLHAQDTLRPVFSTHPVVGISVINIEVNQGTESYGLSAMFAPTKNSFQSISFTRGASVSYQIPLLNKIFLGLSMNFFLNTFKINDRVLKPTGNDPYIYNSAGAEILPGDSVTPSDTYYFRNFSLNLVLSVPMGINRNTIVSAGIGRGNRLSLYHAVRVIYSNENRSNSFSFHSYKVNMFNMSVSTKLHSWGKIRLTGKIEVTYTQEYFSGNIAFYNTESELYFHDLRMLTAGIGVSF